MRRTITGRAVARLRRRRAAGRVTRGPSQKSALPLLGLALALLGSFGLGRLTAPAPPATPQAEPEVPEESEEPPVLSAASSSTQALCPCPRPRRPGPPKLAKVSRPIPPAWTPLATRADPTSATQRYLGSSAPSFAGCARGSGAPERVHLEIRVSPDGAVENVRLTNLDPVPADLATCVEQQALQLRPPGFDGVASETFGLTLVL